MSSTIQSEEGFSTEKTQVNLNGRAVPCTRVKFGTADKPRSLVLMDELSPGEYFDFIEAVGGTKSEAAESLAILAFRLVDIDGAPAAPFVNRADVKQRLDKIGNDGVTAISRASNATPVSPAAEPTDAMSVVGNF